MTSVTLSSNMTTAGVYNWVSNPDVETAIDEVLIIMCKSVKKTVQSNNAYNITSTTITKQFQIVT